MLTLPDDVKLGCERAWSKFYDSLDDLLKRFPTDSVGPVASHLRSHYRQLYETTEQPRYMLLSAPFRIAFLIEASCASARGHRTKPFADDDLRKFHNLWHSFSDPYETYLLKTDFDIWIMRMWWSQIESQVSYTVPDVARYRRIFATSRPMARLDSEFSARYGLSLDDWCKANFCVLSRSLESKAGAFSLSRPVRVDGLHIRPQAIDAYLTEVSKTPREVGRRFRQLREAVPPWHHLEIRSVFSEFPILDYGGNRLLAPFPERLLHDSGRGIYRRIKSLPSFSRSFGPSIEGYVSTVLGCIKESQNVYSEDDIQRAGQSVACDFIVQGEACSWLIECKGVAFTRNVIHPGTIAADSSTHRLQDGLKQLVGTAKQIREGRLHPLGINRDETLVATIVTYDYIPFANLPRYLREFIVEPSGTDWSDVERDGPYFAEQPFVLDLESLELLVILMNAKKASVKSLASSWREEGLGKAGDWDTFLKRLGRTQEHLELLPFMQPEFDALCAELEGR